MARLLPPGAYGPEYGTLHSQSEEWIPVFEHICRRHGLPCDDLTWFADGVNMTFGVGKHYVVKLYVYAGGAGVTPERTMLRAGRGRLGLTIPQVVHEGARERKSPMATEGYKRKKELLISDFFDRLNVLC